MNASDRTGSAELSTTMQQLHRPAVKNSKYSSTNCMLISGHVFTGYSKTSKSRSLIGCQLVARGVHLLELMDDVVLLQHVRCSIWGVHNVSDWPSGNSQGQPLGHVSSLSTFACIALLTSSLFLHLLVLFWLTCPLKCNGFRKWIPPSRHAGSSLEAFGYS